MSHSVSSVKGNVSLRVTLYPEHGNTFQDSDLSPRLRLETQLKIFLRFRLEKESLEKREF